jgi:lipoprotein-anchoring transpeptidase ErfK/SrfK
MKLILVLTSVFLGSNIVSENSFLAKTKIADTHFTHKLFPSGKISIVINKSSYELNVYDDKGWFATYPVVFGNNSLEDKKMEGDRCTPEGIFHIISKRIHEKWDRFLALDYPTKESYEKFKKRKEMGEIPSYAKIGGSLGIHGTWPHDDYIVDHYKNWTLGCISMKNSDVEELYSYVAIGTKVVIRK